MINQVQNVADIPAGGSATVTYVLSGPPGSPATTATFNVTLFVNYIDGNATQQQLNKSWSSSASGTFTPLN